MKNRVLWIGVIVFYILGDFTTTYVAIEYAGLAEQNPFMVPLLQKYGYSSLLFSKMPAIALGYFFYRYTLHYDRWYTWYGYYAAIGFMFVYGLLLTVTNTYAILYF